MKRNVVIVSGVFPPEQVTSAFLNYDLAHELAKEYSVTVLRPYPTRPIGSIFETADFGGNSFETILVDSYTHPESELVGRFRESIDFGKKSAAYIKKHHLEISFVYNDGWQLFGLFLVARVCRKYRIPYMVPIQDIYPECLFTNRHYSPLLKTIICRLLFPIDKYYQKHATCVRTISEEMRDYLAKTRRIEKSKYLVVNNWQNDDDFLKVFPDRDLDGKLVFSYVGSVNNHSNVDLMIRAFVAADIPSSELRIFGGGNMKEECIRLVNTLGMTNVVFGYVSRDCVPLVQSQADVLILALPAGNGNLCLPSKLTSYMLSGKPVIASVDIDSSTHRIISRNHCGLTVSPDDVEGLACAMKQLAQMTIGQRLEMGRNSRDYALEHLTRSVNLSLVVERIHNILN